MKWTVKINNKKKCIEIPEKVLDNEAFSLSVDGKVLKAKWQKKTNCIILLTDVNGITLERRIPLRTFKLSKLEDEAKIDTVVETSGTHPSSFEASLTQFVMGQNNRDKKAAAKGATIRSPITGTVLKVHTEEGAEVSKGDLLFIIEAMKMENKILATANGKVGSIKVKETDRVSTGAILTTIA